MIIKTTLFVLLLAVVVTPAAANELVSKSATPTGYAWVLEHGNIRQVPCYRTVRRIGNQNYVRERECPSPAESVSDMAIATQRSEPRSARHFKVLANGDIKLY